MEVTLPVPIPKSPRSIGVHVSSIIKSIAIENGVLKTDVAEGFHLVEMSNEAWWAGLDQSTQLRICIGLAWEEFYIPYIGDVVDHPGELYVDGIYLSPDGESMDTILTPHGSQILLALHEVKATYKSINTVGDLSTQWMWLAQTKAYCKAMQTLVAYLHVLFVCGDYTYPQRPQIRVWKITYTQAEIDDNWELMTGYVAYQRQLQGGDQ